MINRKLKRINKKLSKIRKKLFPEIDSFVELYKEMMNEKEYLEYGVGKDIDKFTDNDIKLFPYMYARWKTMKRLIDIQMSFTALRCFDVVNLEREEKEIKHGCKRI